MALSPIAVTLELIGINRAGTAFAEVQRAMADLDRGVRGLGSSSTALVGGMRTQEERLAASAAAFDKLTQASRTHELVQRQLSLSVNKSASDMYALGQATRDLSKASEDYNAISTRLQGNLGSISTLARAGMSLVGGVVVGGLAAGAVIGIDGLQKANRLQQTALTNAAMTGQDTRAAGANMANDVALAGTGGIPFDPNALETARYSINSAGITGGNADDVLKVFAKAAGAANMPDIAPMAQLGTDLLDIFGKGSKSTGKDAESMINQALTAGQIGKAYVPDLVSNIGKFAGQGAQAGFSLADQLAFYARETLGGQTGARAGFNESALFASLAKPNSGQQAAASAFGVTLDPDKIRSEGMVAWLKSLFGATGGGTQGQQEEVLTKILGNRNTVRGVIAASGVGGRFLDQMGGIEQHIQASAGVGAKDTLNTSFAESNAGVEQQVRDAQAKLAATEIAFGQKLQPLELDAVHAGSALLDLAVKYLPPLYGKLGDFGSWLDGLAKKPALNGPSAIPNPKKTNNPAENAGNDIFSRANLLLNPFSSDFLNVDKSNSDAAAMRMRGATINTRADTLGGWFDSALHTASPAGQGEPEAGRIPARRPPSQAGFGALNNPLFYVDYPSGVNDLNPYRIDGTSLGDGLSPGAARATPPVRPVDRLPYVGSFLTQANRNDNAPNSFRFSKLPAAASDPAAPRSGDLGMASALQTALALVGQAQMQFKLDRLGGAGNNRYLAARSTLDSDIRAGAPDRDIRAALRAVLGDLPGTNYKDTAKRGRDATNEVAAYGRKRLIDGDTDAFNAAKTFWDASKLYNESVPQQDAALKKYLAAYQKLIDDQHLKGIDLIQAQMGLDSARQAGNAAIKAEKKDTAQAALVELQKRLQLDGLTGKDTGRDKAAIDAYLRANAGTLGNSKLDTALAIALNDQKQAKAAMPPLQGPQLIRPTQRSNGSLQADFMQTFVRFGASPGTTQDRQLTRYLEEQVALLRKADQRDQDTIRFQTEEIGQLRAIVAELKAQHAPSTAPAQGGDFARRGQVQRR